MEDKRLLHFLRSINVLADWEMMDKCVSRLIRLDPNYHLFLSFFFKSRSKSIRRLVQHLWVL